MLYFLKVNKNEAVKLESSEALEEALSGIIDNKQANTIINMVNRLKTVNVITNLGTNIAIEKVGINND